MKQFLTPLLILTASTALAAATTPAPSAPVVTVYKVDSVKANGQATEKLTPAKDAVPGATYQVNINVTVPAGLKGKDGNPLKASTTFPIPKFATFLPGSARTDRAGVNVLYALKYPAAPADFSEKPTKVVTVKENGVDVKKTVAASPSEYRAVKFIYNTQTGPFLSSLRYQLN